MNSPKALQVRLISGHVQGRVVGWHAGRGPVVDFEDNPHGPLAAASTVAFVDAVGERLAAHEAPVLLTFLEERSDQPVVVGVLHHLADGLGVRPRATVDAQRVELFGDEEIVLRCGKSSLHLRKDGRVLISGEHVETRASTTNRIKGGHVAIN